MSAPPPATRLNGWRFLNPRLWLSFLLMMARSASEKAFGVEYAQYHRILRRLVLDGGCTSVLDVGCGERSPLAFFANEIPYRVGVDAHEGSIEKSRAANIHTAYVVSNVTEIGKRFSPGSFDCVLLLEVIEHLPREGGASLLAQCERIARKRVVASTPNGFVEQASTPENPFQAHISGWTTADFTVRGYEVTGVAGWKFLRGPLMRPKWKPHAVFSRVSMLTEPWFENRPHNAFQILCVKKLCD